MGDVVVGQPATRTNTSAKNGLSLTTGRSEGVPKVCQLLLSTAHRRAASVEAFPRCAEGVPRTSLDAVVAHQGGPSYPHGWDDNYPATSGQPN